MNDSEVLKEVLELLERRNVIIEQALCELTNPFAVKEFIEIN